MDKIDFDKEYYLCLRENNDNYPLLAWDDEKNPKNIDSSIFAISEPIFDVNFVINLKLGAPVPDKPELVDYHYMPPDVFSKKIADVLDEMDLFNAQLLPAQILVDKKLYKNYSIFHIYKEIMCLHRERSDIDIEEGVIEVNSFSIDEVVLDKYKLEYRLVFMLGESPNLKLYHQSVVDKILGTNPKGLRFIRVDEWNIGSSFR